MKLLEIIYLASPYSHKSKMMMKARRTAVDKIGAELQVKYHNKYAFILPITTSATLKDYQPKLMDEDFNYWEKTDLTFISVCREIWVAMIEGWEKSIGVAAEVKFAEDNNIKVRYLDPKTLKFVRGKK